MGRLAQIPALVLLLAVMHPSSLGQACSQSSPPPEFGPTSDEVGSALDRFQPEIEHQMQAQGFSLKSNWWDFKEQKGQVLNGAHLLKMTYVGGLDNRIDLHLLLSTITGIAAVFPVGEGMVHDPKRAANKVQIEQYNLMLSVTKAELQNTESALLYIRLSWPTEDWGRTCVDASRSTSNDSRKVHIKTTLPGEGHWIEWTVFFDPARHIRNVSLKHRHI